MHNHLDLKGINHSAFATNDMNATIHFWRDLLGLPVVAALGKPGDRQYFLAFSPHSYITFFEWPDVEPLDYKHHGAPVEGPFGFDHISLGVGKRETLFHLQDILDAAGFPVSDVIDHGFLYSIYTYDNNRIPLEFSWNTQAVDLLASPMIRDPQPAEVLQEGTEPVPNHWPEVTEPTPEDMWIVIPGQGSLEYAKS